MDTSTLLSFIKRSRKVLKRKKRETSEDHISDIWDDLEHELLEAEVNWKNSRRLKPFLIVVKGSV